MQINHSPAVALLIAATLLLGGCGQKAEWRTAEGAIWHTTYRITYESPLPLEDSILATMGIVEHSLSPFDPQSRISRVNANLSDTIDPLIERAFDISRLVNRASGGRFDPTVSPLVNLWGFGYDASARKNIEQNDTFLIPREQIDSALKLVGLAECRIEGNRMVKKHPATSFNFSAVTKGLACDEVAAMLRRNGCENYLVEIGGEITLGGHNSRGKDWVIQVDAPSSGADSHQALTVITPGDGGVASSGNYRNYHESARYGRFGHTIDPRSGTPAHSDIVAATIVASTCAEADAWATAAMASGSGLILTPLREAGLKFLLVTASEDTLSTITSSDFPFAR